MTTTTQNFRTISRTTLLATASVVALGVALNTGLPHPAKAFECTNAGQPAAIAPNDDNDASNTACGDNAQATARVGFVETDLELRDRSSAAGDEAPFGLVRDRPGLASEGLGQAQGDT